MSRPRPLRVLMIEDSEDDAELIRLELLRGGIKAETCRVETQEEFVSALEDPWDIVLSDFSLPSWNGVQAVELLRSRGIDTPFLLVSGTVGEEVAVASIRSGVNDYLLKGSLHRLAPAVERALQEAETRRAREAAEVALRQERRFLRAVLETLDEGIVACDENGVVSLFNRAMRELHGPAPEALPPEKLGEHFGLHHPDGTPLGLEEVPLLRALRGEAVEAVEITAVSKEGEKRRVIVNGGQVVDEDGTRLGAMIAVHDVTEKRILEERLRQAQKMEALGRLAGGVAHDFNNILTAILGYSELLLARGHLGGEGRRNVDEIRRAGIKGAGLTKQLLAFSRKQPIEARVLDLNDIVREMGGLLGRLLGEAIRIRVQLAEGFCKAKADRGQLEQVLLNLAVNARDAMPRGGTLTLETASVELGEEYVAQHVTVRPGRYALLAISDTGRGMSPEILAKIFEPFFTTKREGTGLGLSTVYGIVTQAGGHVVAYSEPGNGTTFKVYLPEAAGETVNRPSQTRKLVEGYGTVLVVEDQEAVRKLSQYVLERSGYRVLTAGSGKEAEAVASQHEGTIDLLLADLGLPDTNGAEVAGKLVQRYPDLRVLFMSGYTEAGIGAQGLLPEGSSFLQKPFTPAVLTQKVRELLENLEKG